MGWKQVTWAAAAGGADAGDGGDGGAAAATAAGWCHGFAGPMVWCKVEVIWLYLDIAFYFGLAVSLYHSLFPIPALLSVYLG